MKLRYAQLALTGTLAVGWTPAYAYLDPGTGAVLLQVILGGIAGAAVAFRLYWNRILGFLGINTTPATGGEDKLK